MVWPPANCPQRPRWPSGYFMRPRSPQRRSRPCRYPTWTLLWAHSRFPAHAAGHSGARGRKPGTNPSDTSRAITPARRSSGTWTPSKTRLKPWLFRRRCTAGTNYKRTTDMANVRVVKELKVSPERAVGALRRWAYEAIDLYQDDRDMESCFVQTHNTSDLLQPLSETEVEKILEDARDNPESSSVGQLTSDAKSLGIHLEVPQALHQAMRIVEQAGPETLEALLAPKDAERDKAAEQEAAVSNWRDHFKSVGQLQDGDVRMIIADFLPEGINFIGALSGHGKTLFALSLAKSFTTGERFLGKYKPEQIFPVLYLIPESSGRAFKMRCKAFGIPDDPNRFLCRTISDGVTLLLDDPIVLKAVQEMKPIVFLDTMIRFSESKDENSSAENQAVAKNVLALRAAGAISVIGLHHATKAFAEGEITLEACLRGTGDIA